MTKLGLANWHSVPEVALYLKVTPQYVRQLIKSGKLKAERKGTQWLISQDNINQYIDNYDVVIEPDDHPRLTDDIPEIVALSFFSGAMGLDIGMSDGGIKAVLACECNKYCRMTIAQNNPDIALIGDINKYSSEEILDFAKIPKNRKVDVIFGGPPCQSFSTAGARKSLDDMRGNVFLKFLDIVSQIKPTYVVIENVRGLLSADYPLNENGAPIKGGALFKILQKLCVSGYKVSFELYNSANFGAPQIRERLVIIGKLGDSKVPYLYPTHEQALSADNSSTEHGLLPWKTLGEAFAEHLGNLDEKSHHYIEFPQKRLKFYSLLKEGQYWKDLPEELQLEAMGNKIKLGGGKTGFFRRLSSCKPSPTLVTDPTMPATDLCHPTKLRPLSVEEYKAIQEFPSNWKICGPVKEQYRQLGNAVPIKLGQAIAKVIINDMKGIVKDCPANFKYSRYKNTNEQSFLHSMNKYIECSDLDKRGSENDGLENIPLFAGLV